MESDFNWQLGHPSSTMLMAALDRELSAQQGVAVEQHVSECPDCATRLERLAQVSARLAEFHYLASDSPLREFELRLPTDNGRVSPLTELHAWFRRPQFLMPAAALAVLLLGLVLWTNSRDRAVAARGPRPQTESKTATNAVPAPRINGEQQRASKTQTERVRVPRHSPIGGGSLRAASPRPEPKAESNAATPQAGEVFWSLPYSDPALIAEGAEMVRADLPREAFLMAGVPLANLPATNSRERIAADVLIGADGLPRAIRPARQQVRATLIPTQL